MSEHYEKGLTQDEYEAQYNAAEALVFGEKVKGRVYAILPSLDGVTETGVGVDEQHAREDFLEKLELLVAELQEKVVKVKYDLIQLDYTNVKDY